MFTIPFFIFTVPRCPKSIPEGRATEDDNCFRIAGQVCQFTCKIGYQPITVNNAALTQISCGDTMDDDGYLQWNEPAPCECKVLNHTILISFLNVCMKLCLLKKVIVKQY